MMRNGTPLKVAAGHGRYGSLGPLGVPSADLGWDGRQPQAHTNALPNATLVVAGPGASSSDKVGPGSGTSLPVPRNCQE